MQRLSLNKVYRVNLRFHIGKVGDAKIKTKLFPVVAHKNNIITTIIKEDH